MWKPERATSEGCEKSYLSPQDSESDIRIGRRYSRNKNTFDPCQQCRILEGHDGSMKADSVGPQLRLLPLRALIPMTILVGLFTHVSDQQSALLNRGAAVLLALPM